MIQIASEHDGTHRNAAFLTRMRILTGEPKHEPKPITTTGAQLSWPSLRSHRIRCRATFGVHFPSLQLYPRPARRQWIRSNCRNWIVKVMAIAIVTGANNNSNRSSNSNNREVSIMAIVIVTVRNNNSSNSNTTTFPIPHHRIDMKSWAECWRQRTHAIIATAFCNPFFGEGNSRG